MASRPDRYSDYSGARMPYYHEDYDSRDSLNHDEYPERSPDAPVPLDYKYEEQSTENQARPTETISEENEEWPNNSKRKNIPIDVDDDYSQDLDNSIRDNKERRYKSSYQNRNRLAFQRKDIDETLPQVGRRRIVNILGHPNKKEVNLRSKASIDDRDVVRRRKVTSNDIIDYERGIRKSRRRKARERAEDFISSQLMKKDAKPDQLEEDYAQRERSFESGESSDEEPLAPMRRLDQNGPLDPDFIPHPDRIQLKNNYQNYDDYVDMKRVLKLKKKLQPASEVGERATQSSVLPVDGFRRANILRPTVTLSKSSSISTGTSGSASIQTLTHLIQNTTAVSSTVAQNTSELSLAEKSRLSILKKAQKKESLQKDKVTTKPPVLMQVTERMQTVVMVESPGSKLQRMQAHEIADDSPERTRRAKKLMRHKLLANANNIHDLTDNWDELICDYIDVSLLSRATLHLGNSAIFVLIIITII